VECFVTNNDEHVLYQLKILSDIPNITYFKKKISLLEELFSKFLDTYADLRKNHAKNRKMPLKS
jgi:hypothetical protein